jgi:hypothetical protein
MLLLAARVNTWSWQNARVRVGFAATTALLRLNACQAPEFRLKLALR